MSGTDAGIGDRVTVLEQTVANALGSPHRRGQVEAWQRSTSARIAALDAQLNGQEHGFGLATRVRILWYSQVWVLSLCSAIAGAIAGALLMKMAGLD
jgi:hypothetical protein